MRALITAASIAAAPALAPAQQQVVSAMQASAEAWNAGDLARFAAVFADDASYVTKDGVLRGKAAIAASFRPSFTIGGNTRGRLSIEPVALRTLGLAQELMIARWRLSGAAVSETGMITVVWERRPVGWRIVAEHSS